ncbi:hypothetical protein BDB01DRAFT_784235 [Pilobolus umbonatus]|nr:hypothetical protein BDB01DRAFT_784235 [Pilobolus umbonatus]
MRYLDMWSLFSMKINSIIENNRSISEQDVHTLWLPNIKRIVSIKKIIRMKQGETMNLFTTKRQTGPVFDHEKIKGFKIDVRLLLDYGRNESDLCAGEVAINTYDADKLIHGRSKCIRESKEICDHHIEAGLGRGSVGWGIQISGLEARLMSIHLFREGLFVAVCQDTFRLPQNIKELPEFIHTLKGLEYLIVRKYLNLFLVNTDILFICRNVTKLKLTNSLESTTRYIDLITLH